MIYKYFTTGKNVFYRWFGLFVILVFFASFFFKILYIPNYLIIITSGVLIFTLIFLPIFLFVSLKSLANRIPIWIHLAGLLFCFLLVWILFIWFIVPIIHAQFRIMPFSEIQIIMAVSVAGLGALTYLIYLMVQNKDPELKADNIHFILVLTLSILFTSLSFPLQVQAPDRFFNPAISHPVYSKGEGPLIYIDEGHHNFHTLNDRLITTGRILRNDGYLVEAYQGDFRRGRLDFCRILIIVNALHENNRQNWSNPTFSAFSIDEMDILQDWVREGGSLLLVADHMPLSGAAADLAARFGFELENGYANDTLGLPDYFTRERDMLNNCVVTNGRFPAESVDSILTFTGHAFRIPEQATSFMTFNSEYFGWNPQEAWNFNGIERYSIENYSQGAYRKYGQGRVVMLGEAMMITAQLGSGLSMIKMGMNAAEAPYNYQLLLNIIHWLDGQLN
jgi:hypothetical protein